MKMDEDQTWSPNNNDDLDELYSTFYPFWDDLGGEPLEVFNDDDDDAMSGEAKSRRAEEAELKFLF